MFIVIELQTNNDGTTGTIVTTYADKNEAESKYHSILAAAALSDVSAHAAVMLNERGMFEKSEYYLH